MGGGSAKHLAAMARLVRPMPADFAKVAKGKSLSQMMKKYNAGTATIQRWRKEVGIEPLPPGRFAERPMPDDFRTRAASLSQNGAKLAYGACTETVRKWYREAGIKPSTKRGTNRNSNTVNWGSRQPINFGATNDGSVAAAAANHLRRKGFANVYRATVLDLAKRRHLPDAGKHHYAVSGKGLLHQDEMIAIAQASGFRSFAA